ncbi:MAG TPA: phosphate ABC transporter permease subunit PstC [Polyangiaceae bacterium]|nr:phosphate ABC transporter permease subunit PstC [Polyangiaceae bacterium]
MRGSDRYVERTLQLVAFSSLAALVAITSFIFKEGAPFVFRVGLDNFFSGDWHPTAHRYGIGYMIVGSAVVTGGALLLGVPLGIACAVVLGEMCNASLRGLLKPLVEILAAIPSVVFGFIGIALLLPWIREHLGGPGASALAGALVLGVMILPTIIAISLDALRAVPRSYRDASLAIGATEWQTIWRVVLPAARSGIVAAVILGVGRAVGETMAVVMVTGNAVQLPHSALAPLRTLTANLALEMAYSTGEHRSALFATGVVLFVVIVVLNALAGLARRGAGASHRKKAPRVAALTATHRETEGATPR